MRGVGPTVCRLYFTEACPMTVHRWSLLEHNPFLWILYPYNGDSTNRSSTNKRLVEYQ